ncbi:MAG: hypothetical protein JNM94_07715 [Phycisphaerae bacterium]|nr:hypothetical protein [Phycisphaerae bacterium]
MNAPLFCRASALSATLLLVAAPANAATTTWKLPQSGDWFTPGNWSAGVPNATSNVVFGAVPSPAGAAPFVVTASMPATANVVVVQSQRVQFGDGVTPFEVDVDQFTVSGNGAETTFAPYATISATTALLWHAPVRFRVAGSASGLLEAGNASMHEPRIAIDIDPAAPPPPGAAIPLITGVAACITDFDVTWSEPLDAALVVQGNVVILRRFAEPLSLSTPSSEIAAPGLARELVTYASIDGAAVDISGQVTLESLSPETLAIDGRRVVGVSEGVGTVAVTLGGATTFASVTVGDPKTYTFQSVAVGEGELGAEAVDISANGRFVVLSTEEALLPGDGNGETDIYHVDLISGAIRFVSDASEVPPTDGRSFAPRISADGRLVAFWSNAPGVLDRAGGGCDECPLVVDLATGNVEFAGGNASEQVPQAYTGDVFLSGDGRFVAYASASGGGGGRLPIPQAKLRDRATGNVEFVGQLPVESDWHSFPLDLSADARFVLSYGAAEGLSNYAYFLRDRANGTSVLVCEEGFTFQSAVRGAVSDDGRIVGIVGVPDPETTTLLPRRYDVDAGTTLEIETPFGWEPPTSDVAISSDGRYLVHSAYVEVLSPCGIDAEIGLRRYDAFTGNVETLGIRPDGVGPVLTYVPFAVSGDGSSVVYRDLSGDLAPNGSPGGLVVQRFGSALQPDLDGDGLVGPRDLAIVLGYWGTGDPVSDVDGDGLVGPGDLARLFASWTP